MTRWPSLLVVAVLVLSATAIAGGMLVTTAAENDGDVSPGESVSGVIDVQGATVDQTVSVATFQTRLSDGATPAERAAVVSTTLDRTERRLETLERRLQRLETARTDGSISRDEYRTRLATVIANTRVLDDLTTRIERASEGIDDETLRDAGVSAERISSLQTRIDRVLAAQPDGESDTIDPAFVEQIATVAEAYNERVKRDELGVLGSMIAGERINLHIVRPDGDHAIVSFRTTESARVRQLRAGPHPDSTVRITVGESNAKRLVYANDPGRATSEAFADGEIRVTGIGYLNAIKWFVVDTVLVVVELVTTLFTWLLSIPP